MAGGTPTGIELVWTMAAVVASGVTAGSWVQRVAP